LCDLVPKRNRFLKTAPAAMILVLPFFASFRGTRRTAHFSTFLSARLQWGPRHGYGILQAIRTGSGEVLQVEAGSLYPALHRLERRKWLKAEWTTSENNQRVKSYQLTAAGKKQLAAERSNWERLTAAMAGILNPPEGA
jgi:transcriptional regulator